MNVKIRYAQIDVKRLLRAEQGLELWSPVFKAAFPLDAAAIVTVFRHWAIAPPPLAREHYTQDQFLAEVIAAVPTVHAVDVTKERHGGSIDGCTIELAALRLAGQSVQTVAIEAEDPDLVHRAVRTLRLADHDNENYVRALTRLLDLRPARTLAGAPEGASS